MATSFLNRILGLRHGEVTTAWLMFAYSFLAMTSYNIVKPLTKGKFVDQLGPQWMPVVLLGAVLFIGLLMQAYSRLSARLPGRSIVPVTLGGLAGLLVAFWPLFHAEAAWVSVSLYVFGLVFGILVISQFWTIANDIYDSRQARRLFGFIGGGASLGGAMGGGITGFFQEEIGERNLLLVSAAVLGLCIVLVSAILRRQAVSADLASAVEERGVGGKEAISLLRESHHLQLIALVIGFAAVGATVGEQQLLLMAKASVAGGVSAFLGKVTLYLSLASFVVQVGLTRVIHRSLGLTVALLMLPFGLGATALVILLTGALWAPAAGRVFDSSIRYSLDKTTREVLFLPLSADLKRRAKPFVDVTVDRLGKAVGALLLLVLNPPWRAPGPWQSLSYVMLVVMSLWIVVALVARREYLRSFRRSLDAREIEPSSVRVTVADAATIEALVEELAHPDEASVLYAIDMLEMLDRRNLITPLLLHHESPAVRARALRALESVRADVAERWKPAVSRLLQDPNADVRAAAVRALAAISHEEAPALMHRFLADPNPSVAAMAATVLADSLNPEDPPIAMDALTKLVSDDRAQAASTRREAASALGRIRHPQFRMLLVPLLHDPDVNVAREAIQSARLVGADPRFVPALVSLLGHRLLKAPARETLVSFGEAAIGPLAYFLKDRGEHVWVRRHVPATLAEMPHQASMDALVDALSDPDGFLRYKIIEAIETLTRAHPQLLVPASVIDALVLKETARYYNYLTLRFNIVRDDGQAAASLVVRALDDKLDRTLDRIYRLLGLIHPWRDIAAVRHSLKEGDARTRARAIEYLDNLLTGTIRRRVMPIVDDLPLADKVRAANEALRSRTRDLDDTLAQLVHESDPVVAASAIEFIERRGRWALADDLEFVTAQTGSERLVTDAAAWALRSRNPDAVAVDDGGAPLPVVALADRLRSIHLFDFVSVDELFRIASTGRQVRSEAGRALYEQGDQVDVVHFLIEGAVRTTDDGRTADLDAPVALAFEDMLEGRPIRHTIAATRPAVSLCLDSPDLLTMMSDNIELARGLFHMLLAPGADGHAAQIGEEPVQPLPVWHLPLEPIEKARLLRHAPILSRATVEQLMDLVAIARDVELVKGAVLCDETTSTPVVYYVLQGEVVIERAGANPVTVRAGGTVGLAETLAGLAMPDRVRVTQAGHALRLDQAPLFDVLADHVDLLQGLFSGVLNLGRRPG